MSMTTQTTEVVETFKALREVRLGFDVRQAGDFIHEYTEPEGIEPRALARLLRLRYIERRTVPRMELDAWLAERARLKEAQSEAEDEPEEEEGETPEETPEKPSGPTATEETIEDLGPVEDEKKKKVVRTRRRSSGT